MGTTIIFRRGENDPTSGSGLTLAEPAFNTTLKTFHIGLGHGITAAWVGAPISGLSADIAAGITYKIPSAAAVKNYIGGLCYGNTGAPTITQYVSSFNGLTGAVGGVCAAQANTFTAVQTFTSGISAAGGITFNDTLNGATATFSRLTTHTAGMSGHINISSSNATGNMYLLMARGAGVTAVFMDNTTTPLVYQPFAGNLGLKGITLVSGNDYLYITPTEITATNTVNPSSAYFNFIAEGGNYFQSAAASLIGDLGAVNSALSLNIDPSTRTLTWSDAVIGSGVTSGFFGVNRDSGAVLLQYAAEINSPTGKGLQLIYNDYNGAASNSVKMDVSSAGNYTVLPSGGLATVTGTLNVSAGVCAAGATFTGTMIGATATFSRLTTHSAGLSAAGITCNGDINLYGNRSIVHRGTAFVLKGITTGAALSSNSVLLSGNQVDLQLNSSTGYVLVDRGWETALSSYNTGIKFNSYDDGGPDYGTITLQTNGANTATINLPSANGTLALTSQLMGAVNGSTAATTAVTSFNGLTGAVTGVTVGGANTFTALNSFNAGISAAGGTFTGQARFLAGISAAGGVTLAANSALNFSGLGNIEAIGSSLVLGENSTRVYIGDYQALGNSTHMQFRDGTSTINIFSPYGPVNIGDYEGVNSGAYIRVDNSDGTIDVLASPYTVNSNSYEHSSANGFTFSSVSGNINFTAPLVGATASFSRRVTFSAGISAAGGMTLAGSFQGSTATFSGLGSFNAGISASGGVTFSGTVASDTGYRITSNAINAQTGTTYTFLESDNGKVVTFNNGSAVTVTIPTALPVGFNCTAIQLGAGQVGFTAASGLTLQSYGSQYRLIGQHAAASIIEYSANIVNLSGNLVV